MPRIAELYGEQLRVFEVEEGSTINQFMISKYPDIRNFPLPTVAGRKKEGVETLRNYQEDCEVIMRADWDDPLTYDVVLVMLVDTQGGGGGGFFTSIVGGILTAVGAIVGIAFSWTGFGGMFGMGLMMTGIALMVGGVMGMLFPSSIKQPESNVPEASPTYNINGTGNMTRLLQPIPEGFGRMRIVPDIVAQPYYTYEDNEQYLYEVFSLGRGTYDVEEMGFGDAYFWRDGSVSSLSSLIDGDTSSVSVQIVEPGGTVTLFPDNVESNANVSGIYLYATNDPDYGDQGYVGPYALPNPGADGSKFQFDFVFSNGVGQWDSEGNINSKTITLGIEYQQIDDYGTALGERQAASDFSITDNTQTAQRRSVFVNLPRGRYNFWVISKFSKSNSTTEPTLCTTSWEGLRVYLDGTLSYNQSVVAVKMKATNILSQKASEQFYVIYTRKLPVWNGSSWSKEQATRRFDAAIAAICKASWGGKLTDERIDLASLQYCQRKISQKGWTFDAYIDSAYTVFDLLVKACAPYRVIPRLIGDKISFLFEEKDRAIQHVFTTRDIVRGSLQASWATYSDSTPDYVVVSYLDQDQNFAQREVDCELPDRRTEEYKYIQYPIGIVDRLHAFDYGIFVAQCNRYRRITMQFQTATMGRLLYVGDVISIQHPLLRAISSGKVVDWNATVLTIDVSAVANELCEGNKLVDGERYWLIFNKPDGTYWGPCEVASLNETTFTLKASDYNSCCRSQGALFTWMTRGYVSQPTTWVLLDSKDINRRFLIKEVSYEDMNTATITAINDDSTVYKNTQVCPAWGYRSTSSAFGDLSRTSIALYVTYGAETVSNRDDALTADILYWGNSSPYIKINLYTGLLKNVRTSNSNTYTYGELVLHSVSSTSVSDMHSTMQINNFSIDSATNTAYKLASKYPLKTIYMSQSLKNCSELSVSFSLYDYDTKLYEQYSARRDLLATNIWSLSSPEMVYAADGVSNNLAIFNGSWSGDGSSGAAYQTTATSLYISWVPVYGCISYRLRMGAELDIVLDIETTAFSYVFDVSGLQNNRTYSVSIQGTDGLGNYTRWSSVTFKKTGAIV